MSPRIKDIAAYLNLSPATVSMALNNRPGVNERTRSIVFEAAKKLDYQPMNSKFAVAAGNGNLPFVIFKKHGKVVSETPFFSALIEAAENEARQRSFRLSIHYIEGSHSTCREELRNIARESSCGFLLLATEMDNEDINFLLDKSYRYVLLDNAMSGVNADKVLINNFEGAYTAVNALQELGHRNIGYLHSKVWINNFAERYAGFRSAMSGAGLDINSNWIVNLDSTHEGAYTDMRFYLGQTSELPTAFFSDNDIIATGAMKALRELKIDIPGEISIIGFDDIPFCTMTEPSLSTMRVDIYNMVKAAVGLLLQKNDFLQKIEIYTQLILRGSTRELK